MALISKKSFSGYVDLQLDKVTFKEIFDCYYAALCVYAHRFIDDKDTCEDIVQDVFCSAWINRQNLDYAASIKSYLLTSVKNKCLNHIRSNNYQTYSDEKIADDPSLSENMEELLLLNELEDLLTEALSKLPVEYRIAFEMSNMENIPSEKIAKHLQVSTRTVDRYRNKAIDLLRKELRDYLPLILF